MRLAPEARIDDGLLDLVIVKAMSRRALLAVFPKVYSGKHVGHPAVKFVQTRRTEITADRDLWMFGGGEPVRPVEPGLAVTVEVVPGGLAVVGSFPTPPP
jgi:diacylglycerol kinase (ATP)